MTPRVLLFTGKGGVGKTTTAAATALRCADAGSAHARDEHRPGALARLTRSASSSARCRLRIVDNLSGQELDAQERMEESWGEIQAYLMEVFDWAGLDAIEAEELAVFPGLDEIFSLSDIKTHAASGRVGRRSSSTARRPPRRSGSCRCPTSSPGTWTGCSP